MVKTRLLFFISIFFISISIPSFSQTVSWYKQFSGTIDKYPITLHLHKMGNEYGGYYYYNSKLDPIQFNGEDSSEAGTIKLSAYISSTETNEHFKLTLAGKLVSGEWRANEKAKALKVSATEVPTGLGFDYVFTKGTALLRPKMKESPEASYEAAALWPKGNSAQATFLKKIINEEFGRKNSIEEIGKFFLSRKKQFFAEYFEEYKYIKDEDITSPYSLSMSEFSKMEIVFQSSKLLMIATHSYSYTGGAHGNYGTSYAPVDLVNNKRLKIDHILIKTGKAKLTEFLEKSFRKTYGVSDSEPLTEGGLFENKIEPTDNFYVTAKGLWFCYNPYEIGPYGLGEINMFIPFTELKDYLQPGFKKLIG